MNRFNISEGSLGSFSTVILEDTQTSSRAEIALYGAHLLSYTVPGYHRHVNIIDGYCTPEELKSQAGARSCIMAPFSNRIANGFFIFDDEQHQLVNPLNPKGEIIHGYARTLNFKVKEKTADNEKAEVLLFSDYIRRGSFPGFGYCIDLYVRFTLTSTGLELEITGENKGMDMAPFACGWHPYFKTSEDGIDHLVLEVPSENVVEVDDDYIPLSGDSAYVPIENYPELDFRPQVEESKRIISNREINYCFSGMKSKSNGFVETSITDRQERLRITVYQKHGVVYVYTGDELKYRPRRSVAIEPVEFITNAFNRHELSEKFTLRPGASRSFLCGVKYKIL